jgi:hypothetical protein
MKRASLAGVILLAAACSNAQGSGQSATQVQVPENLVPCNEFFVAGAVVDRQTFGDACRSEDDDLVVPRPAVVECNDGRVLVWNDIAWGYVGEGMQVWEADQTDRVPIDEALECLQGRAPAAPPADTGGAGEG